MHKITARWWRITAGLLLALLPASVVFAEAGQGAQGGWSGPPAVTVQKLNDDATTASDQQVFQTNLDCDPLTYRFLGDLTKTMHNGCFSTTAFGLLDVDKGVVIPNGMSEALPLHGLGNATLTALPNSEVMGSLSNAPVRGSYLHLYTYFPTAVQLQFDAFLMPYLQVWRSPNLALVDASNQPIVINAQTMAYSSRGSWLVVESPVHSFLRINMATFDMKPFAPSFTVDPVYDYAQHNSQVAVNDDGRYAAIQSNEFDTFKVYDLNSCSGSSSGLSPLSCASHDYGSYVRSRIPGLTRISHVRFMNDGVISFNATSDTGSGPQTNTYLLAPAADITNLLEYLALGDSFSAGEGAFDYEAGTDTSNNLCHLSGRSYPMLLIKDLFTSSSGHSVACSGAVMRDIQSKSDIYKGQVKDGKTRKERRDDGSDVTILNNFTPGYIAQYEFVKKYQPKIITVGVGGNDIGFVDILTDCVMPHAGNNECYGSQEDRQELMDLIDSTKPKWVQLYRQLHATDKTALLYAIGYPHIAAPDGNCGDNVRLSNDEIKFSEQLIDYLNGTIEEAASEAKATYVDISHALDGHRLCEAKGYEVAVNGLTAGNDIHHILGDESYHPNALGHELMEQAILRATQHFAAAGSAASTTSKSSAASSLADKPKSGRKVQHLEHSSTLAPKRTTRGKTAKITVQGLPHSLQPHSTYTVTLDRAAVLGTIATDDAGDGEADIPIPAGTDAGAHTIEVSGVNQAGEETVVTQTVYVDASDDDADGDGTVNGLDSCPTIPDSGHDADQDGTDDACDGFIAPATTGGDGGTAAGSTEAPGTNGTGQPADSSAGADPSSTFLTVAARPEAGNAVAAAASSGLLQPAVSGLNGDLPVSPTGARSTGRVLGATAKKAGNAAPTSSGSSRDSIDNLRYVPFWYFEDAALLLLLLAGVHLLSGRLAAAS